MEIRDSEMSLVFFILVVFSLSWAKQSFKLGKAIV